MLGSWQKKNTARLQWNTKPRRTVNPKDVEFQTAEVVIPNSARDQQTIRSFFNSLSSVQIEKTHMNRLIWGDIQFIKRTGFKDFRGIL